VSLVIVVPMLGRAHRVAPLVESIRATCAGRVLFALTPGDDEVRAAVDALDCEHIDVPRQPVGDYARKINAGYRSTTEAHILCGADDLKFHPGWYEAAVAALGPGIGVVGTNDLGNPRVMAGQHATHCLVTRDYADRFGTVDQAGQIMHEGYPHEYVDDELIGTAKMRRAWAFAPGSHVEHLHPNWGKAPRDEMYDQQQARMRAGADLYRRRRRLWT